jgi:hypothetical protein
MNRLITTTVAAMVLLCLGATLPASTAAAQEKQRISFKTSAENTKYTQQLFVDVGDVPGHQVRAFELHRIFPSNAPVFNGVRLAETWTRAISDYTDSNGPNTGYIVWVLENGDKFFERFSCVAQNLGVGKVTATCVGQITGGTGKFAAIRGVDRNVSAFDAKAGFNETQWNIEY